MELNKLNCISTEMQLIILHERQTRQVRTIECALQLIYSACCFLIKRTTSPTVLSFSASSSEISNP